jgi:hypothetical protein
MTLSPQDAAQALEDINRTQRRSALLRGYASGAPHVLLWSVLWAAGYGLTYLMPARGGAIWAVIIGIGVVAGVAVLRRARGSAPAWRYGAAFAVLAGFSAATLLILRPTNSLQVAAFVPLVVALSYMLGGLWFGLRFVIAGFALAVLTLAGYFLLREHFLLWMAVVGSGVLLLAGLWLRRA